MCIHMCMYVHICAYMYMYMHVCACAYVDVYAYVNMHICACIYTCMCISNWLGWRVGVELTGMKKSFPGGGSLCVGMNVANNVHPFGV